MGYQRRVHGDFGPVFTFDSSERTASQTPNHKMAELGLKKKEVDAINFAFDVYDFKGDGKVDAFYAGDLIRACNLNPTLETIKEFELFKLLVNLGEKLTKEEAKNLMKELCDPA